VELRVARDSAVLADAALEVGTTQRGGVRSRDTQQFARAVERRIKERDDRSERIEVHHVVVVFVQVGVDVRSLGVAREVVAVEVPGREVRRVAVDVGTGHVPAGVCRADATDAGGAHRVEIRAGTVAFRLGPRVEDGDGEVAVQFLCGVEEDALAGPLARAVARLGHLDGDAAF